MADKALVADMRNGDAKAALETHRKEFYNTPMLGIPFTDIKIYPKGPWRPNLIGADLRGMDLSGVDLSGAILSQAKLQGAKLIGTNLNNAVLAGANLAGANLQGASLRGAALNQVNWTNACIIDTVFTNQSAYKEALAYGAYDMSKISTAASEQPPVQLAALTKSQEKSAARNA